MRALLLLLSALACACAIPEDDTLSGLGAPCDVTEGLCSLDLVCRPDEPGSLTGLCAPVETYGACKAPEVLPGRFGTVEDALTLDEGADRTKVEGVRLVENRFVVHSRIREVDLGDTCAFRALQRVGDSFIFGNTDVASLDGLQSLASVQHGLAIFGNRELESLDGLANLVHIEPCSVGTRSVQLIIARNDRLPASAIEEFLTALDTRFGKAPQVIHCDNGPSGDEDGACAGDDLAAILALQDGADVCE